MKRFLVLACLIWVAIGCGNETESPESAAPAPRPTANQATSAKAPPPLPSPRPTQTVKKPLIPARARTEGLADLVQQYQSLGGRSEERAQVIADVAAKAGNKNAPVTQVVDALVNMLRMENDVDLKVQIVSELSLLEHPAALHPLLSYAGPGQPPEVQEAAIDGADTLLTDLAFTEDHAMLEPIIKATGSQYPAAVRESAISALEDLDDDRAIPALQNLVKDPDPEISRAAQAALDWLQD